MPRTSEPGRSVSSRLLGLMFSFEPGESELSLAQLARKTGLPHPTARRLVLELTRAGALQRRPDGRFAVGLRLWRLGTLAPLTESLRTMAQPYMEDLSTVEIAAILGMTQGAVRARHLRALERLRRLMSRGRSGEEPQ